MLATSHLSGFWLRFQPEGGQLEFITPVPFAPSSESTFDSAVRLNLVMLVAFSLMFATSHLSGFWLRFQGGQLEFIMPVPFGPSSESTFDSAVLPVESSGPGES
jgi:hypothetical protein